MKYFLYGIIGAFLLVAFTEVYAMDKRPTPEKLHAAITIIDGKAEDVLAFCQEEHADTVPACVATVYQQAALTFATEAYWQGYEAGYESLTPEADRTPTFKF